MGIAVGWYVNRGKTLGLKFNIESASLGSTLKERNNDG